MSDIMTQNAYYTTLPERGLIQIEGPDRHEFLQNLVTNDVKAITQDKTIYACLLTAQGKFIHDFFMSERDGVILLDCEGGARAQDLYKRLNMYRLRADIQISIEENVPVYAVFGQEIGTPDPRHAEMGFRSFDLPSEALAKEGKPNELEEQPFEVWDKHRIKLCIPDGSRDLTPNQSTMDEGRMDTLNAINYDKGCYIGQELTARMHYRGLGKKHLYAVDISQARDLLFPRKQESSNQEEQDPRFRGEDITVEGKLIGEMRSSCGEIGLALLKDSETTHLQNSPINLL